MFEVGNFLYIEIYGYNYTSANTGIIVPEKFRSTKERWACVRINNSVGSIRISTSTNQGHPNEVVLRDFTSSEITGYVAGYIIVVAE